VIHETGHSRLDTFRLGDAAFAALAAGRPSAATIGLLSRAQQSRHLLLLSEISRLPGGKLPTGYAERTAPADPMLALHTAATLAALRSGTAPPPGPIASRRQLIATHDGLRLRIRLEDTDPNRDRFGLPTSPPLTDDEVAEWQARLDAAWQILVARHRPAAETIAAVVTVIVPLAPADAAAGISATSADAFGAVAISPPADATALAVGLLHEAQHSVLNAVRTLFDLIVPPPAAGYSPWRDDPRPPFGILHGAYAYQAVTRFWRIEATPGGTPQGRPTDPDATPQIGRRAAGASAAPQIGRRPADTGAAPQVGPRLAAFEFARWREAVVGAADGLLGGDALTAAGRRFVTALRDEAGRWLPDPVDDEVARLAAGANADHRARWRLRNLQVPPETVAAMVAARQAGAPPPAPPEPTLRPGTGRTLERSHRLDRIHRTLRDPARNEPNPSEPETADRARSGPGDDAYLRGTPGAAFDAYVKELVETTGRDPATWAGLALVSPYAALRDRPELVRAVFLALDGRDDLHSLAGWLSG
jgi:HEXXH motif-containing protein